VVGDVLMGILQHKRSGVSIVENPRFQLGDLIDEPCAGITVAVCEAGKHISVQKPIHSLSAFAQVLGTPPALPLVRYNPHHVPTRPLALHGEPGVFTHIIHTQSEAEGKELRQMAQIGERKLLGGVSIQSTGRQPRLQVVATDGKNLALRRIGIDVMSPLRRIWTVIVAIA
jgi:hypothetical protein